MNVHPNFKRPKWYDGFGESRSTYEARRKRTMEDLRIDGYSIKDAASIWRDCYREKYATQTENGLQFMTWTQRIAFERKMMERGE